MRLTRLLLPAGLIALLGCDAASLAQPGAPVSLLVRDNPGTAVPPARPLILVDGKRLPAGYDLSRIDTREIETVEIVRGPAAERLFGAEGRAGIIQITTRAGRP